MKKYYYLDENGNKKNYVGKIINDYSTNETYGLLSYNVVEPKEIDLVFHKPIEAIEGWNSYFSYINDNDEKVRYTDYEHNIRKNYDNTYYFTKVNKSSIDLIYHEQIKPIEGYFTYKDDNGEDVIYDGKSFYDKFTNSYYFYK